MLISYLDCSQYPISDEQYYREDAIACMEKFLAPYKSFFHTGHWWCPHRPHETLPLKLPTVETDKCEFDTYATIEWVTDPLISALPLTSSPMTSGALTSGSLTSRALKVGEVASLKRRRWGRRKAQVEEEKVEEDTISSTALPEEEQELEEEEEEEHCFEEEEEEEQEEEFASEWAIVD